MITSVIAMCYQLFWVQAVNFRPCWGGSWA